MCLSHHVSSPGGGSGLRSLWAVISREARSMPSNSAIRSRPKMSPCLSRTCRRKPQAMKTGWSWKRGHCLHRGFRDAQLCMRNRGSIFLGRRTWFLREETSGSDSSQTLLLGREAENWDWWDVHFAHRPRHTSILAIPTFLPQALDTTGLTPALSNKSATFPGQHTPAYPH